MLKRFDAELGSKAHSARIAVAKVDTEGYEPLVLEALRPVWLRIDNVVTEVQPLAWASHSISAEAALTTFRDLVALNGYTIVTLPHP